MKEAHGVVLVVVVVVVVAVAVAVAVVVVILQPLSKRLHIYSYSGSRDPKP